MRKSALKFIILPLALIVGMSTTVNNDRLFEITKNIEIFLNVYKELNANYVDDIDPSHIMRIGIDAMVNSLDPYTNYISESQVEGYRINKDGKYQGIGAKVETVNDQLTIVEPYEGSPVLEAGLKAGDQIVAIDGILTKGKPHEDLSKLVRGVPGTSLQLTVTRPGEFTTQAFEINRGQVTIPNVPYSGEIRENIAYIALKTFTPDAGKNVARALKNISRENPDLEGVILDLRNNGGGLLREAIAVSNIFVPRDIDIVSVKGKVIERDASYKTRQEPVDLDLPLVVLINKKSASASEIVSGVIQDLDRGVLLGQRSFGKGLVQNTKEIGYNSRIKLTTSKYYIPSGRCIQSVEYEDGEPKDIPDDQRGKFRTKRGRTVLDGGGVTPDVKLDPQEDSAIVKALKKENMIFRYVNEYMTSQPDSIGLKEVVYTDYSGFEAFLNRENFEFKTDAEDQIDKLKEVENDQLSSEILSLEKKIAQLKSDDLKEFSPQIQKLIEVEIAGRYHLQKGKAYQQLKLDTEIDEAVALIKDKSRYQSLLK